MLSRKTTYVGILATLIWGGAAHAGIITTSVQGDTVYGATSYCCVNAGGPTYIADNVTGNNDILTSPGHGYQTANPVIANNVAQSGIVNGPYTFWWTGGNAPLSGAGFGSGATAVNGAGIYFALSDTSVGCCTASYDITSIDNTYTVGGGGFKGNFGAYLSIAGTNFTASDSAVASAIVEYSINGGGFVFMPQMVLAAGGNCNNVAIGGAAGNKAAVVENGCVGNRFEGLSIDNLGMVNWAAGTTIQIIATVTAYADPASGDILDSFIPDQDLINLAGDSLPDFTGGANTGVTPEPASIGLSGLALFAAILARRRFTREKPDRPIGE